MEKVNFLPRLYDSIYEKKKNKKYIVILVFFIIIEAIILNKVVKNFNNYKRINEEILNKNIVLEDLMKKSNYNLSHNGGTEINNLSFIKNDLLLESNYKEVFIKESVIVIKLYVRDTGEYLNLIRKIENDKKYNLIYVSPYEKIEKGYEFTIKIEVIAVAESKENK